MGAGHNSGLHTGVIFFTPLLSCDSCSVLTSKTQKNYACFELPDSIFMMPVIFEPQLSTSPHWLN